MTALIPYLCVHDAAAAIEFYRNAFGADQSLRMTDAQGKIGHAEITIGGARLMLSDEWPEGGVWSPRKLGGTSSASMALEVDDADAVFAAAVAAGATVDRPVTDQPYGERSGWLIDPFGYRWNIATRTEELSKDELRARVQPEYEVS